MGLNGGLMGISHLLLAGLLATAAPGPALEPGAPPEFSESALMAHARFLASPPFRGREAGTREEDLAAAYVVSQLEARGLKALPGGVREQEFEMPFRLVVEGSGAAKRLESAKSRNVFAFLTGADEKLRDEIVVLGAHFDHLGEGDGGVFPGAEDNASGVAVVLEIAAALAGEALPRSVLVAFFEAEEMGMVGSRAFVDRPPIDLDSVVAMVNVDMIGRPFVDQRAASFLLALARIDQRKALGVVGTRGRPGFRRIVDESCAAAGLKAYAPEDFPPPLGTMLEEMTRDRGDNFPFEWKGIPALFYGSGESDDYHKPSDTIDKLDPSLMAARARAVFATVTALARAPRESLPPRGEAARR